MANGEVQPPASPPLSVAHTCSLSPCHTSPHTPTHLLSLFSHIRTRTHARTHAHAHARTHARTHTHTRQPSCHRSRCIFIILFLLFCGARARGSGPARHVGAAGGGGSAAGNLSSSRERTVRRDETCPFSTEGRTRRVQLVRERGGAPDGAPDPDRDALPLALPLDLNRLPLTPRRS